MTGRLQSGGVDADRRDRQAGCPLFRVEQLVRDDEKVALAEILDAVGPEGLRVHGVPGPQIIVDTVWQGWGRELLHLARFLTCVDVAEPIDDEQLVIDRNDRAADLRHGEIIAQSQAGYVERQKSRVDVLIERDRHRIAYVLPREKVPDFAVAREESAEPAVRTR
ncbi:MAG: hypothetical protein ACXWJV_07335, partial [Hyphomicrobium sp.]